MSRSYEAPKHTADDRARLSTMKDGRVRVVCSCGYRSTPMAGPIGAERLRVAHEGDTR